MTADEMKKEVRNYCLNLILNSNSQEWDKHNRYIKDNIMIRISTYGTDSEYFSAHIYEDNSIRYEKFTIKFNRKCKYWFNKEERTERKKIKKKYDELKSYFDNKKEYNEALETYKLLPIKELRKNKLKAIKNGTN